MSLNHKEYRKLTTRERNYTVFHCTINFMDDKNPAKTQAELQYAFSKLRDFADANGCKLLAAKIMDTHIHVAIASPGGPAEISKFWRSFEMSLVNMARSKEMDAPYFRGRPRYRPIKKAFDLIVVTRYIINNGKTDGHTVRGSLENEFRYNDYEYIDIEAWKYYTGLNEEDLRILLFCEEDLLPKKAKDYDYYFKKKRHLYQIKQAV